jgi:integrase
VAQIMPQPWQHPKSGVYYFRKVVPAPLRAALGRTEFRISLGTKSLRDAKLKYPEVASGVDAKLRQAAGGPASLTQLQITALAGKWYRKELEFWEQNPDTADNYALALGVLDDVKDYAKTRRGFVAREVEALLAQEGLMIDQQGRDALSDRVFDLMWTLNLKLRERAQGDYSRDPQLEKFPAWTPPATVNKEAPTKPGERSTLGSLFEDWKRERNPPPRTAYEWSRVIKRLEAHLGHDDPARIAKADIVAWKDALLASGKSPKTTFNHMAATKALFGWAVRNERLSINPASGVAVIIAKNAAPGSRRLPYSDADAKVILEAARKETKGAKRWVPWLLAFTGARLEEVCQAHASDVRQGSAGEGGAWYLDVNTDDVGKSLKNPASARKVPLHAALVTEGFLKYVAALPKGAALFPDLTLDVFGKKGGNFSKWYTRWARETLGIKDKRLVAHSWRHRFKDLCRAAGVEKSVHDALTGHKSGDVGDSYGLGYPLKVLASAVEKLPAVS